MNQSCGKVAVGNFNGETYLSIKGKGNTIRVSLDERQALQIAGFLYVSVAEIRLQAKGSK